MRTTRDMFRMLLLADVHHHQTEQTVNGDDSNHDSNSLAKLPCFVIIERENSFPVDPALVCKIAFIGTRTSMRSRHRGRTSVCATRKLVHKHPTEHVSLSVSEGYTQLDGRSMTHLIVNVVEHISPEHIESLRGYEKAIHGHPQAVCECYQGEGDDEIWKNGGYQHDERFGGHEIQEEPHHVGEECVSARSEIDQPVRDQREHKRDADF